MQSSTEVQELSQNYFKKPWVERISWDDAVQPPAESMNSNYIRQLSFWEVAVYNHDDKTESWARGESQELPWTKQKGKQTKKKSQSQVSKHHHI